MTLFWGGTPIPDIRGREARNATWKIRNLWILSKNQASRYIIEYLLHLFPLFWHYWWVAIEDTLVRRGGLLIENWQVSSGLFLRWLLLSLKKTPCRKPWYKNVPNKEILSFPEIVLPKIAKNSMTMSFLEVGNSIMKSS